MHVCVCVYPTINGFVVSTGMSSCQVLTVLWQNLGQPKCHNAYPVCFQIYNGIVLQTGLKFPLHPQLFSYNNYTNHAKCHNEYPA